MSQPIPDINALQRALNREKRARRAAESLLEDKSRELFALSEELRKANEKLSAEVSSASSQLEFESKRFEGLVNTAQDVIFTATLDGVLTFVNPAVTKVLGFQPDDFVGRHFTSFVASDDLQMVKSFYQKQLVSGRSGSYLEFRAKSKNNKTVWIGQTTTLMKQGDAPTGIMAVARDITTAHDQAVQLEELSKQLKAKAEYITRVHDYAVSLMSKESVVDIVDEVTSKLMSNLDFEDCIIYLKEGNVLRQVAALGPKEGADGAVVEPITLRVGQGITGHVAHTGVSEIVPDTRLDPRYIQDDAIRLSELTVPIIDQGEVIGVIDSEHREANFFTQAHVDFVETIATLIASKIRTALITERATRAIKQSEEKYRSVIENMELGVMEVDSSGLIVKAYPRFCEMVGYAQEELVGLDANDTFLPENAKEIMREQDERRQEGQSGVYEITLKRADGGFIDVLISGAPIFDMDGKSVGSIGIHYDISHMKRLQKQLEIARNEAEDAQEAEKQFLAQMSHEIRTPLNAIIGMADFLQETNPTREQRQYLEILKSSADLLLNLINDILDLAKIESGRLESNPSKVDINELMEGVYKTFRIQLLDKPVDLLWKSNEEFDTYLINDRTFINQILFNLVGNAVKFTQAGFIRLEARIVNRTDESVWVEFTVEDSGIGMKPEVLERIFKRFRQADATVNTQFGGSGLGLAITKKLVDHMGGTIRVTSSPGEGSTFKFEIPMVDSGTEVKVQKDADSRSEGVDLAGMRVLVAEDNKMNLFYARKVLQKLHAEADFAMNGREAVEMAGDVRYDLILMDIQMPVLDGIGAATEIRNGNGKSKQTPIIALTASSLDEQRQRILESGMQGFVTKPFVTDDLITAVNEVNTQARVESEDPIEHSGLHNVDIDFLEETYEGDGEYADLMLNTFQEATLPELNTLRNSIFAEQWEQSVKLAHKIKPSFTMIGLPGLTAHMQQVEDMCRTQESNAGIEIEKLCTVLDDALPQVIQIFKSLS